MSSTATTHLQTLRRVLFDIPEDLPPSHRRYVIASNLMFVFALAGHTLFSPFHWVLGHPPAFIVNLLCVPVDLFCLLLNHRRRFAAAFGIWASVMTLHTAICSLAYGWDSGFHYYILSLTVFVFIAPWDRRLNCLLLFVLMGLYVWLDARGDLVPPLVALAPPLRTSARIANILVNFVILGFLAYHYARAAERTQNALEESQKTLAATLAASPVGIALIKQRTLFWANDTLLWMLGYAKAETMERDVLHYHPSADEIGRFEQLAHTEGRAAIDVPDTRMTRNDGTTFPCHIKIRPIAPKDPARGSIVVILDISEQKQAERERTALQSKVQRAEKMEALGTLAGGVAHDLNNILSGVLSYPELLLLEQPPNSPMRKPLETIRLSGEKAAAIVQDLLTLARRGVPVRQATDLNTLVRDYLDSPEQTRLARYHPDVRFETRLTTDLSMVSGSPVHLAKTLMNLISNASEAIVGAGLVTVSTRNQWIESPQAGYEIIQPGTYAVLSVADNGEGISADCLERIFEPFYTKKVMGRSGTGLGLAVVWGTVKDHGGYVDVRSVPGRGTCFELYFPRTEQPAAAFEANPLFDHRGRGEHVLVVDDVAEQRVIAVNMLEKLGYRADAVAGGEAALAWLHDGRTDLLMLDMIMDPGIDGLETYQRVLQEHPGQKAIIVSGYSETQRVTSALALGAACYLKKPYTLAGLARSVRNALQADAP